MRFFVEQLVTQTNLGINVSLSSFKRQMMRKRRPAPLSGINVGANCDEFRHWRWGPWPLPCRAVRRSRIVTVVDHDGHIAMAARNGGGAR